MKSLLVPFALAFATFASALPASAQKKPARPPRPTATPARPAPTPTPGKPDLAITAFGFVGPTANSVPKPSCQPNTIVYTFAVTVMNQGSGPSPSSASLGGKGLLTIAALDRPAWTASVPLPAIGAGKSVTMNADVLFLTSEPAYMVKVNHPFLATVDPDALVVETDDTNNTKGPLMMGPPAGCERLVKRK